MNCALPMATRLKNKNKSRVDYEPRSAHGCAVKKKKVRVNLEPHLAHGHVVNKKIIDLKTALIKM